MARLKLVLATSPRTLLTAAATPFLARPETSVAFPTPGCLLALREGGLRDDLFALAADAGVPGWFDPPLCVFRQLPDWLGATDRVPCSDYERFVLVSRSVRQAAGAVFKRLRRPDAYMDAVDRLFGELVAEGVDADRLEAAMAARTDRDAFERDRDTELAAAFRLYLETLSASGRRDGRDWLVDAALAAGDADELARRLGGRRELRIYGLQDLRGGWPVLLRVLAGSPALDRITLYSSTPLELPGLEPEVEWLGRDGLPARLFDGAGHVESARTGSPAGATMVAEPASSDTAVGPGSGAPALHDDVAGLPLFEAASEASAEPAGSQAASAVSEPGRSGPRSIDVVSAPDAAREMEEVARRVRLLVDGGVAPHRIAVVARHARPSLELAVRALGRVGVPVTARRRFALQEIPVVRSMRTLVAVAAQGWTRHGLVELAEQPYLELDLDVRVLNHIGYRKRMEGLDAWSAALDELLEEARAWERRLEEDDEGAATDRRAAPPRSERVTEARDTFRAFAGQARELNGERPLGAWLDWLKRFLEDDPWGVEKRLYRVPDERVDLARVDAVGWAGARQVVQEWVAAVEAWGGADEPLEPRAFEARLNEVLTGDMALWTETQRGVRVLEGLAAALREFEHVFIVGLEGGRFPHPAPRSPILAEHDREALAAAGLPLELRAAWDTRERELFRSLVAGARRSLTLSHARLDTLGAEIVRSAFIDEVEALAPTRPEDVPGWRAVTPGVPVLATDDASHAVHAATVERRRETGLPGPYNGLIEDPELLEELAATYGDSHLWSPTRLEEYARCPWAWFSGRLLRLERQEDPDTDIDPRVRGVVLHDALRRFYDAAVERIGGPVLLRDGDLEWATPLLAEALDAALENVDDVWLGHPALAEARRRELERMLFHYLAFEAEQGEDLYNTRKKAGKTLRTGVVSHELAFEDAVLEVGGVRFRFRGFIDRVEEGIDERVAAGGYVAAVDYKTSRYSAPGGGDSDAWDDHVVLQVPLYAHALTGLRPDRHVARVEYRAIKHRSKLHSMELVQVQAGAIHEDEEAAERMRGALDSVAGHVRGVRGGAFPARPAPSCGCPPFCHAWDICRVAGGPKKKGGR